MLYIGEMGLSNVMWQSTVVFPLRRRDSAVLSVAAPAANTVWKSATKDEILGSSVDEVLEQFHANPN